MFDPQSEVNAITPVYIAYLGFKVQKSDVSTKKIDNSLQEIYGIVIATLQVLDKLAHSSFFQKTFLLAEISIQVVFACFSLFLVMLTSNLPRTNSLKGPIPLSKLCALPKK